MSKPQAIVSATFTREWRIRRPYVHRYLDSQFAEQFFKDGSLRLSSFSQFSKHNDEERKDTKEGRGVVTNLTDEDGGQTMMTLIEQGYNAYVLCGTTRHDSKLQEAFQTDSGFRINDTIAFANVVSSYIPGFMMGTEGTCVYSERKEIVRDLGKIDQASFVDDEKPDKLDVNKIKIFVLAAAGDDLFYLKLDKYAHQNEYRLIWIIRGEANDYLDIKCPAALEFCARLSPDEA